MLPWYLSYCDLSKWPTFLVLSGGAVSLGHPIGCSGTRSKTEGICVCTCSSNLKLWSPTCLFFKISVFCLVHVEKLKVSFQQWTKHVQQMLNTKKFGDIAFGDKDCKTAIDYYSKVPTHSVLLHFMGPAYWILVLIVVNNKLLPTAVPFLSNSKVFQFSFIVFIVF